MSLAGLSKRLSLVESERGHPNDLRTLRRVLYRCFYDLRIPEIEDEIIEERKRFVLAYEAHVSGDDVDDDLVAWVKNEVKIIANLERGDGFPHRGHDTPSDHVFDVSQYRARLNVHERLTRILDGDAGTPEDTSMARRELTKCLKIIRANKNYCEAWGFDCA